ncbi:hypothetical protein [Streptomyces aureoverticillatus]|uniref:hypothetical protein n=1 Tax=Streptomyces aureoverticillatus TaxID=66871 RepID=UPI0013D8E9EA|nr:hypothetical protein [Streptomyces aureoverticillatus]QIB42821.1 hypothetical protein G3H79_06825 [Streptomyces aureoverticillatus]
MADTDHRKVGFLDPRHLAGDSGAGLRRHVRRRLVTLDDMNGFARRRPIDRTAPSTRERWHAFGPGSPPPSMHSTQVDSSHADVNAVLLRIHPQYARGVKDQASEDQLLRKVLALLDGARRYETLTQSDSRAWVVAPGSALAGDDTKTAPYQVSHSAWQALTVAVDHLHCFRRTLVGDAERGTRAPITMHTHGQFSLLRGVIENSARAVWMLGPPERLLRIQRRLSLQASDHRHSDHMLSLLQGQPRRSTEARMQQLTDLVTAAGTAPEDAKGALRSPRPSVIVREAGTLTPMGGDQAEVIWSCCSSLAHGDAYGTLSLLDRSVVERQEQLSLVRFSSSSEFLYRSTDRSIAMVQRGFALFEERAACHH